MHLKKKNFLHLFFTVDLNKFVLTKTESIYLPYYFHDPIPPILQAKLNI